MPASYGEYQDAFESLIGTTGEAETWYGEQAGGVAEWLDIFESTGIDFDDSDQTVEAFEVFLLAFYPQDGMSGDDWANVREQFYDLYGIDDHNIDWEAWRAAIGYE
jgi:hypothetical protein